MQRMLVVIFDDESKAYEASLALNQLDAENSITIHAESVIAKNTDGTVTVKQADDDSPIRTIGGTAIGSLIGLLGGSVGVGVEIAEAARHDASQRPCLLCLANFGDVLKRLENPAAQTLVYAG